MLRKNAPSADNQQGRSGNGFEPWYVSGFVDGEGSFHVAIYPDASVKTGWRIIPEFHVSQRVSSKHVLERLILFFDCGYVKANHQKNPRDVTFVYVVRDRNDLLKKIIPFFEKHQLQTEKASDFKTFARVVRMMSQKIHCVSDGLQTIIELAYTMNGSGRYRKRQKETIV